MPEGSVPAVQPVRAAEDWGKGRGKPADDWAKGKGFAPAVDWGKGALPGPDKGARRVK